MANRKQTQEPEREPHPWHLRLQEARRKQDLSEEALAKIAGLSEGTIKNLERGNGLIETFLVVCKALGVHPADITNREVS